jgi:hypothetical protein
MARSGSGGTGAGSSSSSKSAARGSTSTRKAAAKKGGQARARKQASRSGASKTTRGADVEAKTVAEFRDALRKNLIKPREMVLLSRDRIEEVLGEAVDQGRVTARDAQRITSGLVKRGQRQTTDVLKDLEQLLGRGRDEIEGRATRARTAARGAAKDARGRAKGARGRATRAASPALARVDRVRRGTGVGPNFPITGYDKLTAAQVQTRLSDLTPAQLRKVRDHERRNAARKTILKSIESKLG